MALIKCPECNHDVSSAAKACPYCGFDVSEVSNDTIQIKIDKYPLGGTYYLTIKDTGTGKVLADTKSGSIAIIKSNTELSIKFCGMFGIPMYYATVSPKSGGKYRATWGDGLFKPTIESCAKVDYFK